MLNHLQRAAARTTTLARQPGSISGETKLRAVDQPIAATLELPSAVPLMALSTGFWAFKTLAAAHELDLFSRLAGGASITVAGLAEALGLHPRPAEMLLTGCAALRLLEKTDGCYRNTPLIEDRLDLPCSRNLSYQGRFCQKLRHFRPKITSSARRSVVNGPQTARRYQS
ncbi:hypothetical protein V1290_003451 [Bradyrhizobium sp. AZCC 1578]|uniref:methyltransferase family protein n=1 Tax=Bradyrhizobium sp. AZCC 1578 TaxID=3117027 RepID=UPI002FF3216F